MCYMLRVRERFENRPGDRKDFVTAVIVLRASSTAKDSPNDFFF